MDEGWIPYEMRRPPDVLCQFRRHGSEIAFVARPSEFAPEFNIANLEWRLTGIAKHYLDSVLAEIRAQSEPMPPMAIFGMLGRI